MNNLRGQVTCRGCDSILGPIVFSMGNQPLSNALLGINDRGQEALFPLDLRICAICGLGQIGEFVSPEGIFSDYTYFSSASKSWLSHCSSFANEISTEMNFGENDLVLEIASNDGYLLQYFQERNIRVLGIEPAANVADEAISRGIPTINEFFGTALAEELIKKDICPILVVCNNVLAHVPDINDFLGGLKVLAKAGAVISIEAPSMLELLRSNLFDTIYHEHFSYLSAHSVKYLAGLHQLTLYKIDSLKTHGGSLRYWLSYEVREIDESVKAMIQNEVSGGLLSQELHSDFAIASQASINLFREWVLSRQGPIVGFGAAAKATVLVNAANLNKSHLTSIADSSPSKQNKLIPGCRIPILSPDDAFSALPDSVIIFPWNISEELVKVIETKYPKFNGEIWKALPVMQQIK